MRDLFAGFYDSILLHGSTVGYSPRSTQYLPNNRLTYIKNFIVFVATNLLFNVANVTVYAVMLLSSPVSIELAAQTIATLSIFLIAVPVGLAGG